MSTPCDSLSLLLLERIAAKGITHADAAAALDCTTGTIGRWIRGGRPQTKNIGPIAAFCGIPVRDVVALVRLLPRPGKRS